MNLKPKEYSTDIKQYPWFSVENKDDVYYRRMNQQHQEKDFYSSRLQSNPKAPSDNVIAGKHTYGM